MDLKQYIGKKILYYRKLNKLTQQELAEKLGTTKQTISKYEKGQRKANQDMLFQLCDIFSVSVDDFFPNQKTDVVTHPKVTDLIQDIMDTSTQLEEKRQQVVLDTAKTQLEEQNASKTNKVISIDELKEDNAEYKPKPLNPVTVIESLAAGNGHSYSDENERFTVYTDRDDLANYHLASFISGDSMEPEYNNGDVALIRKGYDNIQGAVYAIDYNGKTFMKKLYNDGYQFRLVSINDKYDDILIGVPVDEDIYFNIVGRVVDSFIPMNRYGELL